MLPNNKAVSTVYDTGLPTSTRCVLSAAHVRHPQIYLFIVGFDPFMSLVSLSLLSLSILVCFYVWFYFMGFILTMCSMVGGKEGVLMEHKNTIKK